MSDHANGHSLPKQQGPQDLDGANSTFITRICAALEIVHSPYSTNESRKEASIFLEDVKASDEAPYHGFNLAADTTQQPVVRHYALSLLEYAIRHRWAEYSESQATALRGWILQLSQIIVQEDPLYLRNKVAQLWVEIAKRSWGGDWFDMDELLVKLWEGAVVHKEFVLFVLETLSEDIFNGEDTTALLREGTLSKVCVEIFTPAVTLAEAFPTRQVGKGVRYGEEGWLVRLGLLLDQCLDQDVYNNEHYRSCAVKTLAVFRSVMTWAIPRAVAAAECVKHMCKGLACSSVPVQMASVEALHSLYSRTHFSEEEFHVLVCPMYNSQIVDLLRKLFQWSVVDPQDIDDEKYLFSKKFSEMMSNLGNFIDQQTLSIPEDCDLPNLLNLFLAIVRSPSLVVSIPVLVTWTRLLRSETIGGSPTLTPLIAPLLEICSSRLIRYESLPEDSEDPTLIFLLEDIDTLPERHAFLGNYRRYSIQVIETIVRRKQSEAIYHILSQIDRSMQLLYDGQLSFSVENYSKTSMPILRVDAHFTVVEAVLKGYIKSTMSHGSKPPQDEHERISMENNLESWCERLLDMQFEDPIIRKRILQLAAAFSITLDKKVSFMLKVLEALLVTRLPERPEFPAYSDAVKELQTDCMHELLRLATKMPDHLLDVYDQLEAKINEITATGSLDSKQHTAYQTFLFVIIHRSTRIDPDLRMQRLQAFIAPIKQLWQNPELPTTVDSFDSFCNLLGLGKVRDYLVSRRVHEIQDWGSFQLDAEGQALQADLNARVAALPLRPTKSFLGCSTEKVDKRTQTHKNACILWHETIPIILPSLLNFLSHAHAFHNPTNWLGLPSEMRGVVSRILTDRFWQAGISGGSKDEFYARVSGTRNTMEGFASSIRGSVRSVRETCYSILFSMSRLETHFYGFQELPGPLAHALFANAHCLSSHQLINLLNLVRYMTDDCPVPLRSHFVPPLLATCFAQMDEKIVSEWEKLSHKQQSTADDEGLTEEMKEESILRQLTHSAVMMVAGLLDPARTNESSPSTAKEASTYRSIESDVYPNMREFCFNSTIILEPILLFCTHAIRMRDSRSCGVVLRVFRSIVSHFARNPDSAAESSVREFISSEVLKACITSLHEPYFVDLQKDLAQLIAAILIYYSPLTGTPRSILLSLPGLSEQSVDRTIELISRTSTQQRQQRAYVLDLLKDLKGVSINEMGRISKTKESVRKERSKMQQEFMTVEDNTNAKKEGSPDLEGIASMFG